MTPTSVIIGVEDVRTLSAPDAEGMVDPDRVRTLLATYDLDVLDVTLVLGAIGLPGPAVVEASALGARLASDQLEVLSRVTTPNRLLTSFLTRFGDSGRWAELGSDGLLVTAALQRAEDQATRAVLVLSDDPDLRIVHRYPTGCPVIYVSTEDHVGEPGRSWRWPATTLSAILTDGPPPAEVPTAQPPPIEPLSPQERTEQAAATARLEELHAHRAAAMVDVYDVFRQGLAALGAAHLPDAPAARQVLAELGYADVSLFAAVPRVPAELLPGASLGWQVRDRQFGELVEALHEDPSAPEVRLGEVLPPDHSRSHLGQRRIVTQLLADAFWALRHLPADAPVLLFSDRWDVVALQWHLRSLAVQEPARLIRVGATPLTVEAAPIAQIVLPDHLLADLVGAPRDLVRTRQRSLHASLSDDGGRRWRVIDVAPEHQAVIVEAVDDPGAVAFAPPDGEFQLGDLVEFGDLLARLESPHSVVPRLVPRDRAPALTSGRIVHRDRATALLIDLTGDGRPDASVLTPVGEDLAPAGARVTLQHGDHGLLFVGGDGATAEVVTDGRGEQVWTAEVVAVTDDGVTVRLDDGRDLAARALPGGRARVGDHLLVTAGHGDTLLAISSAVSPPVGTSDPTRPSGEG